jgi:hypothetical protein
MTVKELTEAFELVSNDSHIRVQVGSIVGLLDLVRIAVADADDDEEPYVVLFVEER